MFDESEEPDAPRKNIGSREVGTDPVTVFCHAFRLTPRQRTVFALLIDGLSQKSIAVRLSLAPTTIRRHAEDIYRKCGMGNQRETLAFFARTVLLRAGRESA
jgi:LuxR family maltose regulon positive regulatory protein